MSRLKNKLLAKIFTRFPSLVDWVAKKIPAMEVYDISWMPFTKDLRDCKIALVTTSGVHLNTQKPFDMKDPDGDPTYREIPLDTSKEDLMITHDYYDHKDADRDINIVFPIDRLKEMQGRGEIAAVSEINFGLMGHIDGKHVHTLINETAPEIAKRIKGLNVDAVLLTPG